METPKVYKILMSFDDASKILVADAIEQEGYFWLVPEWLGKHPSGPRVPERMIRLNPKHLKLAPPKYKVDYYLSDPLPAILRDARSIEQIPPGFEVRFAVLQMAEGQMKH